MRKIYCLIFLIVGILLIPTISYSQQEQTVYEYRVGSEIVNGTEYWTFTYEAGLSGTIKIAVIAGKDRYLLHTKSYRDLGNIELVLDDNSIITFTKRPKYDQYINDELTSIYYITSSEFEKLLRSNIDHIVTTTPPGASLIHPDGKPRRYIYKNSFQKLTRSGFKSYRNNTVSSLKNFLSFQSRNNNSLSSNRNNINSCNCESATSFGNRSLMCPPIPVFNDIRYSIAPMLIKTEHDIFLIINMLNKTRKESFSGPAYIQFKNGKGHFFALHDFQYLNANGYDLTQGMFRIVTTSKESIKSSKLSSIRLTLGEKETKKSFKVDQNNDVLFKHHACLESN
ncbi:MAG: hypothetical protein WD511_00770 [Balneolaceae bacterium]